MKEQSRMKGATMEFLASEGQPDYELVFHNPLKND